MKRIFIICYIYAFSLNSVWAQGNFPFCFPSETPNLPFYLSDTYLQGDKAWDNLREYDEEAVAIANGTPAKNKYLPKGSLVYVYPEFEQTYGYTRYQPVKVLSAPRTTTLLSLEEIAKKSDTKWYKRGEFRKLFGGRRDTRLEPAEGGEVGFLHREALQTIEDQDLVFVIDKDSPLLPNIPEFQNKPTKVKFAQTDSGYRTKVCCSTEALANEQPVDSPMCVTKFSLEILRENDPLGSLFLELDPNDPCKDFSSLLPYDRSVFNNLEKYMNKISEMEGITLRDNLDFLTDVEAGKDLVKVVVTEGGAGPYGSYHYTPDDAGNSDAYATPDAACAFTEIAKQWSKLCTQPGCQLMFGDIYHKRAWKKHRGHESGNCFDVRPFRTTDDITGGLTHRSQQYDTDKTRLFMKVLKKAGAKNILFNDPKLVMGPKTRRRENMPYVNPDNQTKCVLNQATKRWRCPPHDNHIHFCLRSDSQEVLDSCTEGINIEDLEQEAIN